MDTVSDTPLISIVIPARNAVSDLRSCLQAIQSLERNDIEVIVVDDASTDSTPEVAMEHKYDLIRLPKQSGPAAARNRGVAESKSEIILFIDSDIMINDRTIPLILKSLSSDDNTAAVVGMLDKNMPYKNISSQYFNLRKHFDYLLINDDLKNLYTSITAIKKTAFQKAGGFNEGYKGASVEDAELGRRLHRLGYRIRLNKEMTVVHHKKHSIISLITSDFLRASSFIKFLIREKLSGNIVKEKRFVSFRIGALGTVTVVPLLLLSIISLLLFDRGYTLFYICLAAFILANYGFLKFTARVVGWRMNMLMPFMLFIDSLAIFLGILSGSINYFRGRKY